MSKIIKFTSIGFGDDGITALYDGDGREANELVKKLKYLKYN